LTHVQRALENCAIGSQRASVVHGHGVTGFYFVTSSNLQIDLLQLGHLSMYRASACARKARQKQVKLRFELQYGLRRRYIIATL
jgi:hypothetical protein